MEGLQRGGNFIGKTRSLAVLLSVCLVLCGCGKVSPLPDVILTEEEPYTGEYRPGDYDSEDLSLLVRKNAVERTLTFLNLDLGKEYTLSYDGTTCFYNKYGEGLSLDQVSLGSLVDVRFLKDAHHLSVLNLSDRVWSADGTDQYEINMVKQEITLGSEVYKISSFARFFSGGEEIHLQDINALDQLSFRGIGNMIYSATVERGHGYLRLAGQEYFVGGWIQVGLKVVQQVTEDMLIPVSEGAYQVLVSNSGTVADKSVSIARNQETVLDLSDVKIAAPKTGQVLFSVLPAEAELYVDGSKADLSGPVELTYGIHQIICRAKGYKSVTKYLSVGQASAGINIELEVSDGTEEEDGDAEVIATYYQVHVDAPEKAELYLDGAYVGVVPCSFKKTAGSHVITLSRKGYVTRSYTITVDSEEKDASFSFADLESDGTGGEEKPDGEKPDGEGTDDGIGGGISLPDGSDGSDTTPDGGGDSGDGTGGSGEGGDGSQEDSDGDDDGNTGDDLGPPITA